MDGRSEFLDNRVRRRLENCYGADLSGLSVVRNDSTRLRKRGAAALSRDGRLYFEPQFYRPDTRWGQWILAHETAHYLQQTLPTPRGASAARYEPQELEQEADEAANAFISGREHRIRGRASPDVDLCLLNILALLLIAAGISVVAYIRTRAEDPDNYNRRALEPKGTYCYETAYGYIPLVGSYSQMMNGRSEMDAFWGTTFFIMDCTIVLGVVRAAMGMLRPRAAQGLAAVARGVGSEAQANAYAELSAKGFKTVGQAAAQQALNDAVMDGASRYTLVAVSEGPLNHSAVYIYDRAAKQAYKLHGSVFEWLLNDEFRNRFAREVAQQGPEAAAKWFSEAVSSRANRLSIYALDGADRVAGIQYLNGLIEAGKIGQIFARDAVQPGCAGTQAMILERLGVSGAESMGRPALLGRANQCLLDLTRSIPVVLDTSRSLATAGEHLAIQGTGGRVAGGTLVQAGVGYGAVGSTELIMENLDNGEWPGTGHNTLARAKDLKLRLLDNNLQPLAVKRMIGQGLTFERIGPEIPISGVPPISSPPVPHRTMVRRNLYHTTD